MILIVVILVGVDYGGVMGLVIVMRVMLMVLVN